MKKNSFYVFLTAIILAVVLLVCAIGSSWFTNGNFKTWFNNWGQKQSVGSGKVDVDENMESSGAVFSEAECEGISLYAANEPGVSMLEANTYTLTATITPSNTSNQKVTYTAYFKNPSSQWANGKSVSNYVDVVQSIAGSLTATVHIVSPFSEQVIIKCTSQADSNIYATTTVDYVCDSSNISLSDCSYWDDGVYGGNFKVYNGTIVPEARNSFTFTFNIPNYVVTQMNIHAFNMLSSVNVDCGSNILLNRDGNGSFDDGIIDLNQIFTRACTGFNDFDSSREASFWRVLSEVLLNGDSAEDREGDEIFTYSIYFNRVHNGVDYGRRCVVENEALCLEDWSGFEVYPSGLSLNYSSIIAG